MIERQIQNILGYPQAINAKIAEVASVLAESQQGADTYYYYLKEGKLFSPTHKIPVINSTASEKDKGLIRQIESWANQNQEGIALWISPPTEHGETSTKITSLQIIGGKNTKMIKNTSALADLPLEEIQETIDCAISFSINPLEELNPSEARYRLIILREETPPLISDLLQENWEDYKKRIKQAVEITNISKTNPILAGTIFAHHAGSHSLSCPTIELRGAYIRVSESGTRFLECTCPFCHLKVKAKIEGGKIHCPFCQRSAPYHC